MSARPDAGARAAVRPAPAIQPAPGVRLQRSCACGQHTSGEEECAACRKHRLQRRADGARSPFWAPAVVHDVLREAGRPLDEATRAFMEPRLGHDFSRVRVHADAGAAESARSVGALAYTVGTHVVFGAGRYAPQSAEGRRLLAHELTHVVQQAHGGAAGPVQPLAIDGADTACERQADAMADRVAAGAADGPAARRPGPPITPARSDGRSVQRRVSPRMPTIRERLSTGIFNSVTDREAHDVLVMLKNLAAHSETDFRDTVAEMEREGLVARFLAEVSEADRRTELDTLRRVSNARVFTRRHREGGTTVTTTVTGSCTPERYQRIARATTRALGWLDRAVALTDAFLSAPGAPGNTAVRDALTLHFKSVAPNVVRHVRGRLDHIRTDLRTVDPFVVECHDAWDITCRTADAYIPGGEPERMVFCGNFFDAAEDTRAGTIVHESAHTQVGGVHITDRAYDWERLLRFLTTEEALTNAESYSLFVEHLAKGRRPRMSSPRDTREDCPNDWWNLLERAIARAQKANGDARSATDDLTAARVARWSAARIALLGGRSQADIDRAKRVYQRAYARLQRRVNFECEPGGGGRCGSAQLYWYAAGDLHVCPSWRAIATEPERVISLLSGMYGYFDLEDNGGRRDGYARLAVQLSAARRGVPALGAILGDPGWSSDRVRIHLDPQVPPSPDGSQYVESGTQHERLSNDVPRYEGPDFQSVSLPFRCRVFFAVDRAAQARPAPFTPPRAHVLFEFTSQTDRVRREARDPRLDYDGAGVALDATFPSTFSFALRGNGPLHMRFELVDPDSGVTRVYDDTMAVVANRIRDILPPGPTMVA